MVNTKQAPRRKTDYRSLADLKADLDRLDAANASGNLGHTGNWTPGEILEHTAKFWKCSLDGFPPGKPPLPLRMMAQLLFKKKAVQLGNQTPPGFKLPKSVEHLIPTEGVSYEQGAEQLRECIARVEGGQSHIPESPLFGKLTNEQWTNIHLGHCGMHLSFISIDEPSQPE